MRGCTESAWRQRTTRKGGSSGAVSSGSTPFSLTRGRDKVERRKDLLVLLPDVHYHPGLGRGDHLPALHLGRGHGQAVLLEKGETGAGRRPSRRQQGRGRLPGVGRAAGGWGVQHGHPGQVDHGVEIGPVLALVVHVQHTLAPHGNLGEGQVWSVYIEDLTLRTLQKFHHILCVLSSLVVLNADVIKMN